MKFGPDWPMREEVTGGRRTLHNVEIYDLKSSPNTIRVTKAQRNFGGVYVEKKRNVQEVRWET